MSAQNPDSLFDASTTDLVTISNTESIALWSDDKRKEFVVTFESRVKSARFILERTAAHILMSAKRRKFISDLHLNKLSSRIHLFEELNHYNPYDSLSHLLDYNPRTNNYSRKSGGRSIDELEEIAKERAKKIVQELPVLNQAIRVIDPVTAKKMDDRDKLMVQGQKLAEQLDAANEKLVLSELDQNMTIGEFRKMVKERERKRKALLLKLNEIGKEGSELEDAINKKLYRGLPGLSEAIVEAATAHVDRATALDQMLRRVGEQVQFGDSTEAMELLKFFESDEASLPETISNSIKEAVERLKLSVQPKRLKKA